MRIYIISIVLIGLITACNKDSDHPIPNTPVYLNNPICINDVEYLALQNIYGNFVLENEGFLGNGIILVNTGLSDNGNPYKAYDATCPYEVDEGCTVLPDESSISLVTCGCCGSTFEVIFGAVNKGPANYPLKTYKTAFDGDCIRVYN
ncbi:MAG: hypothetical protein PF517_09765 [Salinivirgaceae bacterium]|jgi:Rieske Fe-S protein|nr:hypothetical protein [Salinivirgaceae bacterium]